MYLQKLTKNFSRVKEYYLVLNINNNNKKKSEENIYEAY